MHRRDFLKLVIGGTTISLWSEPLQFDKLLPFLDPQSQLVPGVSTWYATSCRECPAGCGQIVRNREGRATKAEGNPLHPINGGTLCARGQAALQGLYDPDRLKYPISRERGRIPWDRALAEIGHTLATLRGGGRVAVISDLQSGSLAALIQDWLRAFGSDRFLIYEPFNYEPLREANRLVFGRDAIPDYHLDRCDLIISFAADFLETWISPVKWIRRFAETRVPKNGSMGKFVYVGPRVSMTAFNADEHLLVKPGDERWLALAMLNELMRGGLLFRGHVQLASVPRDATAERIGPMIGVKPEKILSLARQFGRAKTALALAGLPVPGGKAAVESAVAANLLNLAAQSPAVDFSRTHALGMTARAAEISHFLDELGSGQVKALLIIGANPVYSLPPDYRFYEALKAVPTVVSITPFFDETAQQATWVLPASHPLESWGDYEPETGIANLVQPIMGTRHDTRPTGDVLLSLAQAAGTDPERQFGAKSFYDYLRTRWASQERPVGSPVLEQESRDDPWQEAVKRGGWWSVVERPSDLRHNMEQGAWPPLSSTAGGDAAGADSLSFSPPAPAHSPSLWVYPSAFLFDGRGANKRWLQENPDVVTHAVWDSWVELHPDTAAKLKVASGQVIEFSPQNGRLAFSAPAFIYPGIAPDTLAVQCGQGHESYGRYAAVRGGNAFRLLSADPTHIAPFPRVAVQLDREQPIPWAGVYNLVVSGEMSAVVTTDGGVEQYGRHLVEALLFSKLPARRLEKIIWPLPAGYSPETDLYPPHSHVGHRWAMAIDLSRCVGCGACVTACHAENNCAIVGKEWMAQGREMSWLRIERYYQWDSPHTPALLLPMLCQHCDAAPCEPVCPVFAASHTEEGLNAQIYNRCIGTRYCSHNCPYKVRRFNWRNYDWPEELTWQLNPDVTVRSRGVMEKCTFCVQRIREAEARAKKQARPLADGEITPACAQTCPAGAFVFGDLMDPGSRVSRLVREHPRRFQVLPQLNTKPAVIYLQRVINDSELT